MGREEERSAPAPGSTTGEGAGSPNITLPHTPAQYLERQLINSRTFIINRDCPLHADVTRHSPARGQGLGLIF